MHDELPDIGSAVMLLRYELLESERVSTLNRLLQCLRNPEELPAHLTLRDPESGKEFSIIVVGLDSMEHDSITGNFVLSGVLDSGFTVSGSVFAHPDGDVAGTVTLRPWR